MSVTVPDTTAVRKAAKKAFGFVPNLIEELNAHNPAAARAYLATIDCIDQSELTQRERQAVMLAVSRYNDCHYDTSAHATTGEDVGLSRDTIDAITRSGLPSDRRLRVLVQAARLLLDKRGWLDDEDLASLRARGVGQSELYEINAIIGIKTFSNYVNHVARTPVDPELER